MKILSAAAAILLGGISGAAQTPRLSGNWVLNAGQSRSDFPAVTKMSVEQTHDRIRMAQTDKDGRSAHSFQGDCVTDARVHAVPDADDETISCRWAGSVLVSEQVWNSGRQRRAARTTLDAAGNLVQDIRTNGPDGVKNAHLVWVRQESPPAEAPDRPVGAPPPPVPADPDQRALAAPYATPSVDNHQKVVRGAGEAFLHSLEGFEVSLWASGLKAPRFFLQGRNGEILLSDAGFDVNAASPVERSETTAHAGAVYVFLEGDPSRRRTLLSGLDRPYGMALWKDFLYVAEAESIKRYPYDNAAFTAGKAQQVVSLKGMNKGHWTRSLLFDPDGNKLYVGIGSEQNVEAGEDPRRAAINRYNPDGSGHEIYAGGTRNPIGLHWYPASDTLWAAVQERDELGDDLVPDYFTHVEKGAFYGWPWTYIGQNQDPRMGPPPPSLAAKMVEPDALLGSHVAVLDFCFYTGRQFPEAFAGGAFLALHGSWNRSRRDGFVVRFIPFQDGAPSGPGYDFVAGWTDSGDEKTVLGRPSGVFQRADGTLLIADDGAGRIWQVRYRGEKPAR
ncbi:MAG: PQQ-dependent sugar dehydrogenase [Acidobacteriota bacterium]